MEAVGKAGEGCRSQDRAVPGCGHRSGWQKWPGSDDQLSGGQPIKENYRKETLIPLGQTCKIHSESQDSM